MTSISETRHLQKRVRLRIPPQYRQEPVLSDLISHYGITVNITAALLSGNARSDGWFDLELRGSQSQLDSALGYLNDLNLETWIDGDRETDGW